MAITSKHSQLQIRVSAEEKSAIRDAARRAGLDMSAYVLCRVLPPPAREFQEAMTAICGSTRPSFALAHVNELLARLTSTELRDAVAAAPEAELSPFLLNYVAAMVEVACQKREIPLPGWTRKVAPLEEPVFGSTLRSLRLHLLTHSPAAFRRRNIFIDASVGDRV
jgi:uncharacterized protein (DUF1778 family)